MALTASLLGLEKKSLREQALIALRSAITSGELEPGRHLVETELSEMLQISRGTLREALRQLEQEGLVSAGARGRLSVRHLDVKEIRDIFAVRGVIESLAARTLSDMPDKEAALAELRDLLLHLLRRQTAVRPHDADDGDVDVREDVGRRLPRDVRPREHEEERHHDEGVRAPEREANNPHGVS